MSYLDRIHINDMDFSDGHFAENFEQFAADASDAHDEKLQGFEIALFV